MTERHVTRELARFVVETRAEDLPRDVIGKAKACFLDWLGCALLGSTTRTAHRFRELAQDLGGANQATIVGSGQASCLNAALVNGAMSHELEFDDVHRASISHPGAPVIPAALAAAEREHISGIEFLTALVVGYDVSLRIGEAVNPAHYKYWHTTGTCGTFGAAAAAAKVMDLDEAAVLNALGNAGSQAAGLWEFLRDGAMTKVLHTGKAAMNGLLSALLARKGFTGATRILEGDRGFCRATSSGYDLQKITSSLGDHYKVSEVGLKAYPCCGHTHTAVTAALDLALKQGLKPFDVETLTVRTYDAAVAVAGNLDPRTPREAKFSLPYCAMVALLRGKVGLSEFDESLVCGPEMRELVSRVTLLVDAEANAAYPDRYPSALEAQTSDGAQYRSRVDVALGDPENPMTRGQRLAKFRELASAVWSEARIEEAIHQVESLDAISDVCDVASLFGSDARGGADMGLAGGRRDRMVA